MPAAKPIAAMSSASGNQRVAIHALMKKAATDTSTSHALVVFAQPITRRRFLPKR